MKLENEAGFAVESPPRKSYNPFDSDDDDTDGFTKSNVHSYDIKSFEKSANSLTFHLDNGHISWEEALLGHSSISNSATAIPANANGEGGVLRKDTELFTDKTVTECELPELMVCCKENSFHPVKDICIDEGIPAHDKVWVETRDNQGSENLISLPSINGNSHLDVGLGNEHQQTVTFIEEMMSRSEKHLEKDAFIQECTEDSVKGKEFESLDSEDLGRQHSPKQCGTDYSIKVDEFKHDLGKEESESSWQSKGDKTTTSVMVYAARDHHEIDELNYIKVDKKGNQVPEEEHNNNDLSLEHMKESSTKPSITGRIEACIDSSEERRDLVTSPESLEPSLLQESAGGDVANALSYNGMIESRSILLDFNSSLTTLEKEGKEKKNAEQAVAAEKSLESETTPVEKPPKSQTMSRHDDGASGRDKWVDGEASFSATAEMLPPASIIHMGPNVHSGSISLRSEGSAASTRSFAFPVLQAEWNSSPVRMAKADQRHCRKHRGWVHSLVCCKF